MRSKLSLFAATAAIALTAHAAIDLGNGVKVVPNAITSVNFNDNLFLSSANEQDETIIRLSPGVLFGMGDGAVNNAKLSYNEEFQFYNDLSDLNTSLSLVDFSSRYDDGKMKIAVDAWFHQANQATRDTANQATLVNRDLVHGAITDEVNWTDKSSVKIGAIYDDTNYKPASYTDWRWIEVPVSYYYQVQPKLDASIGLRYRNNDLSGAAVGSDEYFYNVGFRGEFTAKLTGELQVGYIQFKPDAGKSQDTLGLKANLSLALSPKTNLTLDANNQYGYGAFGPSYRDTGLTAGFDAALTVNAKVRGSVFYHKYDYTTTPQNDDYYGGQVSGIYTLNEHAEFSAAYTYSKNDSNLAGSSFKNNIFSLSATLKY